MIIVIIRRFIRPDREAQFLASYRAQKPIGNPAFEGETLTKVIDDATLPEALRTFDLREADSITYLNIAKWDSWQAFAEHFADQLNSPDGGFDRVNETKPRQRIVLEAISGASE